MLADNRVRITRSRTSPAAAHRAALAVIALFCGAGTGLHAETGQAPTTGNPGCDCYVYTKTLELFEFRIAVSPKFKGWRRKIYNSSSTPYETFLRKALTDAGFERPDQPNVVAKAPDFVIRTELLGAKVPTFGKSITATMQSQATLKGINGGTLLDRTFEAASKAPFGGVPADIRAARAMDGAMAGLATEIVREIQRAVAAEALK